MEAKILELLASICGTDEVSKRRDLDLFESGLLDSLGVIELIVGIEDQLGIKIEPTELERKDIATPDKILDFLRKRQ